MSANISETDRFHALTLIVSGLLASGDYTTGRDDGDDVGPRYQKESAKHEAGYMVLLDARDLLFELTEVVEEQAKLKAQWTIDDYFEDGVQHSFTSGDALPELKL